MSTRTWSPLLFPYNCQLSKLGYFKLMHYATNIIAIRCKFKYSTHATLNVNSVRAKLNKPDKTEHSAKQMVIVKMCQRSSMIHWLKQRSVLERSGLDWKHPQQVRYNSKREKFGVYFFSFSQASNHCLAIRWESSITF